MVPSSGQTYQIVLTPDAWSRFQPRIALSSGKAELYAGMRGISGAMGLVHMMREFKTNDWGRIVHRVDANACRAIMLRRGCGGLKHMIVKSLWVQEAVREYAMRCVPTSLILPPVRKN